MIEAIMYFTIGFFIAVVIGLGLFPLVHNRAVRLTGQRLEAATPLSMAEIQADKDQLRAEFAMSTRRLEMSVEQLKTRTTSQLSELGKKTDAINRLKLEIGEKAAAAFTMEARERSLRDQIRTTEEQLAARTSTLQQTERTLADKLAELEARSQELGERTVLSDSQRVEIIALRTQMESLRGQIDKFEADLRQTEDQLTRERADAEAVAKELESERGRTQTLGARAADLEQQLIAQSNDAQEIGRKVLELEARLSEQGKKLAEREYDAIRLRTEVETVRRTEADLRTDMAAMEDRHNGTSARLRSENSVLENDLTQIRGEHATLQQEAIRLKTDVETARRTEADLRTEMAAMEARHKGTSARLRSEISLLENELTQIRDERTALQQDITNLKAEVETVRRTESDLRAEMAAMEGRHNETSARFSSENSTLDNELTQIRSERASLLQQAALLQTGIELAGRTEAELRSEMAAVEQRHTGAILQLGAEKSALENELTQIRGERMALQQEIANLKREAEESWAGERGENALLRERINEIATEVARLTMVLEGPGSPIEAMLAADPKRPEQAAPSTNGRSRKAEADPAPASGSLADRIRALQARASRIAPPQA